MRSLGHIISFEFITGICLGIEFFTGDNLYPQDKFAMCIDCLIFRVTYIVR